MRKVILFGEAPCAAVNGNRGKGHVGKKDNICIYFYFPCWPVLKYVALMRGNKSEMGTCFVYSTLDKFISFTYSNWHYIIAQLRVW